MIHLETSFLGFGGGFAAGGLGTTDRSTGFMSPFPESVLLFSMLKLTTVSWSMEVSSIPFSRSSLSGVMEPGVGGTEDMAEEDVYGECVVGNGEV